MSDLSGMVKKPVPAWLAWVMAGLAIFFVVGSLVIDRADGIAFTALLLIGIALVLARRVGLSPRLRLIGWASFAILLVAVISYRFGIQTDIGVREVGRFLRFCGFAPLAAAFLMLDGKQRRWVWASIPVGTMLCGIVALYEVVQHHGPIRAAGQSFPIVFGDLALAGAFFSAVTYLVLRTDLPRLALVLSLLGFIGGLIASFLSGTRGAWIALPMLSLLLLDIYWRHASLKRVVVIALAVVAATMLAVLVPADHVAGRIHRASQDIAKYFAGRAAVSAIRPHVGCVTDPRFLEEFIKHVHRSGERKATLKVVTDESFNVRFDGGKCESHAAIRFSNSGLRRRAVIVIRRGLSNNVIHPRATFLVRGEGWLYARTRHNRPTYFLSPEMKAVSVLRTQRGQRVALSVPPGKTVTFIPVATEVGEYYFAYAVSSVGMRLEMWRAAWTMFAAHPVLGVGTGAYHEVVGQYAAEGRFAPAIANFDHPHNEFFAQLSSRGVVGLLALMLMMGGIASVCYLALKSRCPEVSAAAGCGLLLVVGYVIFGLTETIFSHSLAIAFFVFYSAFFLACIYCPDGRNFVSQETKRLEQLAK